MTNVDLQPVISMDSGVVKENESSIKKDSLYISLTGKESHSDVENNNS